MGSHSCRELSCSLPAKGGCRSPQTGDRPSGTGSRMSQAGIQPRHSLMCNSSCTRDAPTLSNRIETAKRPSSKCEIPSPRTELFASGTAGSKSSRLEQDHSSSSAAAGTGALQAQAGRVDVPHSGGLEGSEIIFFAVPAARRCLYLDF